MASKKISDYPVISTRVGNEKFVVEKIDGKYSHVTTDTVLAGVAIPANGITGVKFETYQRVDLGTVSSGTATLDLSQG